MNKDLREKMIREWTGERERLISKGLSDYVVCIDEAMDNFMNHPNPTTGLELAQQMHLLIEKTASQEKIDKSAEYVRKIKDGPGGHKQV